MENRTIQITPTIIGVVVPSDMHISMFDYIERAGRIYLINHKNKDEIHISELDGLDYDDFEQIGICTLPSLEFDFEVDESLVVVSRYYNNTYKNHIKEIKVCDTKEDSFRTRIQKAIQDECLLLVNPYDIKGQTFSNEHQNKWQESESKVIRGKLLIIEKI
jgi:hypothetical protein